MSQQHRTHEAMSKLPEIARNVRVLRPVEMEDLPPDATVEELARAYASLALRQAHFNQHVLGGLADALEGIFYAWRLMLRERLVGGVPWRAFWVAMAVQALLTGAMGLAILSAIARMPR